jgi:hypothetical protein
LSKAKKAEIMPQGDDLRNKAIELVTEIGDRFFELGQTLYEIKQGSLYVDWGHQSFDEYAENELSFGRRKADHYVEIWTKLAHQLGYSWEQVRPIGWSKLSRIVGVIESKKDAAKWLKLAEKHSRRELETLVRDHKVQTAPPPDTTDRPSITRVVEHDVQAELQGVAGSTDGPFVSGVPSSETSVVEDVTADENGQPLHKFAVLLFPEQWSNVMGAMERAGQIGNSDKVCHQLDMIATEYNVAFAATSDGGAAHRLDYYVKLLERVFDVKIDVHVGETSRLRHMSRMPATEPPQPVEPTSPAAEAGPARQPVAKDAPKTKTKIHNW